MHMMPGESNPVPKMCETAHGEGAGRGDRVRFPEMVHHIPCGNNPLKKLSIHS